MTQDVEYSKSATPDAPHRGYRRWISPALGQSVLLACLHYVNLGLVLAKIRRAGSGKAITAIVIGIAFIVVLERSDSQSIFGWQTRIESDGGGRIFTLKAGDDLQQALNRAQLGDTIVLSAGATFTGNFQLPSIPSRTGDDAKQRWITIRSSAVQQLPSAGHRVAPKHSEHMPKIVTNNSHPTMSTRFGAHHYQFVGVELSSTNDRTYNLILLGHQGNSNESATSLEELPHNIVFDRCYIHGNPTGQIRRGIAMNGRYLTVIDCYISDFHENGADSQALVSWNGSGPFRIINNYLEAAGENVMFGGGDPSIKDLVPSDIEFRRNHVFKPLRWKRDHPDYDGSKWSVKNLFELKNARRVLVEGNIFENCWGQSQPGIALVLSPRNPSNRCDWCTVEDITFTRNIVRNTSSGLSLLSQDKRRTKNNESHYTSQPAKRIFIRNNLFEKLSRNRNGGDGRVFQFSAVRDSTPAEQVVIEYNTLLHDGKAFIAPGDTTFVARDFVFQNNIVTHGAYGITGTGSGTGVATLDHYFDGWTCRKNVIIGARARARDLPAENFVVTTIDEVGFADHLNGDYRLLPASRFKNAGTDRQDIGVDINALVAATDGVIKGEPSGYQDSASDKAGRSTGRVDDFR